MAIACAHQQADARAARIDLAAGTLPQAISELARQARVSIGSAVALPASRTPAVRGTISINEALRRLLEPAGLIARRVGSTAWRIEKASKPSPARIPAVAAPQAPPPEFVSEQIVVTAAKQMQSLDSAPFAVSVVDLGDVNGQAHASQGSSWLADNVEGLALTGLGPGRNRMFVRGVADSPFNGQNQSTVAILLDEARLTYAAPDPDLRLVDVERVELLKGPQGSLYGTGALGGIYQIVTRRPDLENASFSAEATIENIAHGETGGSASAVFNLPISRGNSALRVVGYTALEPGWIDTGTRRDSNETRLWGARATQRSAIGEDWVADLTGMAQFLNSRDSQYVYAPGARARLAQLPEPHDNDLRHAALRIVRPGGPVRVHFGSAMTWHDVTDTLDATVGAQGFGLPDPGRLRDARRFRLWDSELRLDGAWGGVRWLAGAAHLQATQRRDLVLAARTTSATLSLGDDRSFSSDSAVFGQIVVPLGDTVEGTVGARLFLSSTELDRKDPSLSRSDDRRRSGVTPSAALSWQPHPGRLFYLRYGSAIRQAGLAASGTAANTVEGDELATLEAGWRETVGKRGRLDLGAYYSSWDNLQSDALGANGLVGPIDAGRARILGAEGSLTLPIGDGWRVGAGAIFQSALLVRSALGIELEDRRLPVVPRFTLRGSLSREWIIGAVPVDAGFDLRYVGPARLSFDPALDRSVGEVLKTDLRFGIRLAGMQVGLRASNLLGSESNNFAFGNPLRIIASRQYIPQAPRSLSLTVRVGAIE